MLLTSLIFAGDSLAFHGNQYSGRSGSTGYPGAQAGYSDEPSEEARGFSVGTGSEKALSILKLVGPYHPFPSTDFSIIHSDLHLTPF